MLGKKEKFLEALNAIEEFYFNEDEDSGFSMFQEFAKKHVDKFNFSESENSLTYTFAHQEFVKLFENKLEGIIKANDLTMQEFDQIASDITNNPEEDEELKETVKAFIHLVLSLTDYTSFYKMMKDYAKSQKKVESKNDTGKVQPF